MHRIHVRMPGRPASTTLFRRLQGPFGVGDDAVILGGVDDLEEFLCGFVSHVVLVGFVPPLSDPRGVGPDGQHGFGGEGIVPEVGEGGEVLESGGFEAEGGGGRCHISFV